MLRHLRKLLLLLTVLLVVGAAVLAILARVYETEVKVKLVGALNERLLTPVTVSDMDLTLIARFPMASMRLYDVKVDEVRTDSLPADTLLAAKELFLEFNLWDLFGGNYRVQRIHGKDVVLYPGLDRNGAANYLIWRSDSSARSTSPIALDRVSFDGLAVRYRDARSQLEVRATSDVLTLAGRFNGDENEVTAEGDARLLGVTRKQEVLIDERAAELDLALTFGRGAFHVTRGEVRVGDLPLNVTLGLTPEGDGLQLDLRANGLGLDLAKTIVLLPTAARRSLERFGMQGDVDLAIRYAGKLQGEGPALSIGAKLIDGRMKERRSGTAFTDIFGELALELSPNAVIRKLKVNNLSAKSGSGTLTADWLSDGIAKATVKADVQCDMGLADLLRFAGVDTLEQVGGRLRADLRIDGALRDMSDPRPVDLRQLRISGTAALSDASMKMKGMRHRVEHLDAELSLAGNDATVRGLKAELQGSPIEISGILRNLVPFLLFEQEHLAIEARARSNRLDLAALLQRDEGNIGGKDYALVLPLMIELDVRAQVAELIFEEFKATDITGTIRLKDRVLRASPMAFNTADGAVLGSLQLDGSGGAGAASYPLAIEATIKDIDVKQLFAEFQDFGQEFIGARHLSGRARANVAFQAALSPAMKLDRDRLESAIDIAIDNGAIKGQQQLIAIADHLRKNKLVSPFVNTDELRKRLADVRFAHLENRIEVRDGAVHIPLMEVKSSAMDIEMSGTHGFDDRIDHHLNFRLSDLFRLGDPRVDEFGPVADDGTGMRVFLHMYGMADDPQFENDGAMAANRRREQFNQERRELRAILREDILGRKPDSAGTGTGTQQGRVIIEEEGDTGAVAGAQPRQRRGLGRLFKEERDKEEQGRVQVED